MTVDGVVQPPLQVAPDLLFTGSTFVPLRAVLEAVGLYVEYSETDGCIVVSNKPISNAVLLEKEKLARDLIGPSPYPACLPFKF